MFCTNCGSPLDPHDMFCTSCGAKQEPEMEQPVATVAAAEVPVFTAGETQVLSAPGPAPEPVQSAPVIPQSAPVIPQSTPVIPQNAVMMTNWKNSFFDGSLLGLIGVNIVVGLVSAITLGFGAPAMTCYRLRWIYKHTCIGGYRLKFNGRGGQLFGKYLLWALLTIITIGIYGFWVPIKFKKWEISHVEIESVVPSVN